jgi:hypothetical protein
VQGAECCRESIIGKASRQARRRVYGTDIADVHKKFADCLLIPNISKRSNSLSRLA